MLVPTASDDSAPDWVSLPGLFSWEEVCSLFSEETGHDDEWRFLVRSGPMDGRGRPLYVVCAAEPRRRRER